MNQTVKYHLVVNHLLANSTNCYARVEPNGTDTLDDIITNCLNRGTTLTETDIRAAINLFIEECCKSVGDGKNITTPLVNIKATISGSFTGISDTFDPSRHQINASASPGKKLNRAMKNARPEKVRAPISSPTVQEFTDANSATRNSLITPGGIALVRGENLKFDTKKEQEGIYIVSASTGEETKIDVIASKTETKLTFHIPPGFAPGEYILEVRRMYTVKESLRKGRLEQTLTVQG